ncbi:MAG TPA: cyclase family protein [Candidatus Acidoferrales bacterium]|nr:cyclase family protein [Candidatus Acidoferrales bacterium]
MRDKRILFIVLLLAGASAGAAASLQVQRSGGGARPASPARSLFAGISTGHTRVVDMTYAINAGLPAWPGDERTFESQVVATPEKDGYFARSFWTLEHYGTHMDAPSHFAPGKATLDQIPVSRFFGPAVVIDVRDESAQNSDYRLTTARIGRWEAAHGQIPQGAVVLLRTGWASRWPDQTRYRNMDAKGVMHFPGFSVESAKRLIARGVVGLGIDTLSIDYGASKDFDVHHVSLPAGLYHLENLAHLDQLPDVGAFLISAPIKLEGGSGGPCRVFAILPERN